jgi:hypothetical protein
MINTNNWNKKNKFSRISLILQLLLIENRLSHFTTKPILIKLNIIFQAELGTFSNASLIPMPIEVDSAVDM